MNYQTEIYCFAWKVLRFNAFGITHSSVIHPADYKKCITGNMYLQEKYTFYSRSSCDMSHTHTHTVICQITHLCPNTALKIFFSHVPYLSNLCTPLLDKKKVTHSYLSLLATKFLVDMYVNMHVPGGISHTSQECSLGSFTSI